MSQQLIGGVLAPPVLLSRAAGKEGSPYQNEVG